MKFIFIGATWVTPEHFMPEKDESRILINWMEGQTAPIYINNVLYKYYIGHDSLNKHGYIYLSTHEKNLKHLRFNNKSSDGIYSIKESYFLEYLLTRNKCVVIASLTNTEYNEGE